MYVEESFGRNLFYFLCLCLSASFFPFLFYSVLKCFCFHCHCCCRSVMRLRPKHNKTGCLPHPQSSTYIPMHGWQVFRISSKTQTHGSHRSLQRQKAHT